MTLLVQETTSSKARLSLLAAALAACRAHAHGAVEIQHITLVDDKAALEALPVTMHAALCSKKIDLKSTVSIGMPVIQRAVAEMSASSLTQTKLDPSNIISVANRYSEPL